MRTLIAAALLLAACGVAEPDPVKAGRWDAPAGEGWVCMAGIGLCSPGWETTAVVVADIVDPVNDATVTWQPWGEFRGHVDTATRFGACLNLGGDPGPPSKSGDICPGAVEDEAVATINWHRNSFICECSALFRFVGP